VPPPAGSKRQQQTSIMIPMPVTYQAAPMIYAAPAATTAHVAPTPATLQFNTTKAAPNSSVCGSHQGVVPTIPKATVSQILAVSILQAHGLQHMNRFNGDHPYVVCEVKHLDQRAAATKAETKPMTEGNTLNPFWGETFHMGPWHEGESLEFTVYDKGLAGSKILGKTVLGPELFFPNGISGMLSISGSPQAMLHVIIRPLGPMVPENIVTETLVTDDAIWSKKTKKLRVTKKSKGCC